MRAFTVIVHRYNGGVIDADQLEAVTGLVHQLAVDGADGLAGSELTEVVQLARRLGELAEHVELAALAALEASGYTLAEHGEPTGAWLANVLQLPAAVARRQVTDARVLHRHLQETARAWLDGSINREHVRALIDAA